MSLRWLQSQGKQLDAADRIGLHNHKAKHTFPQPARAIAYRWLDHWLQFQPVKDEVGPK